MDGFRPRPHPLRARRQEASRVFLSFLFFTICGCAPPERQPITAWPDTEFDALAKTVAASRRLPLARDIVFASPPANETGTKKSRVEEYLGMPVAQAEGVYKSVGLLPYSADLGSALADYYRLEELIRYETNRGTIEMSRDAASISAPFEKTSPRVAREAPAVLGIVTALQEQHFKWSGTVNAIVAEDHRLALRAMAVGDSLLTLIARSKDNENFQLSPVDFAAIHGIAAEIEKLGASLPDFLRERLSFPYRQGMPFVYWAHAARGWDGVNALYADPPVSTAQIIHPEKYFIRRAETLAIFPAGLLRLMYGGPTLEQSFGESFIRTLLASEHGSKRAADAAAAWRADRLFFFQPPGGPVTAWFSVWNNDKQAREFYRLYRSALASQQRLRFQTASGSDGAVVTASTQDRGAFLLQVKGAAVLLLNVTLTSRLWETHEAVWQDIEIEPEPKTRPFDSARSGARIRNR